MKKRAAADRPEPLTRRKPQVDRPVHEDERPAARRPGPIIKHAHDLRDVATDARDVTPRKEEQAQLAAPADHSDACMDDQASASEPPIEQAPADETKADEATAGEVVIEAAPDKEQSTDQQQPVLVSVQVAPEAPTEPAAEIVAAAADPQAPLLVDGQLAPAAQVEPAAVAPAEPAPVDAQSGTVVNPEAQQKEDATQANFAATLAASLDDAMAGLVSGDAAIDAAAGAETLSSVSMTTLATPKAATPATAEAPQAAAAELAANLTPETPRPAAEPKAKPATRAVPASEIKAQVAAAQGQPNPAPQPQPAAQALAHAAPSAAFNEALGDGFETGLGNDGVGAPGWSLHLAQGAAAKRPDFIAQLRQHLQELPAHEQVAVNIQRAVREGTNRLTIQLSPAELGKIHVKLEIDEEKRVTAAVTVEKSSTLELLQRDVKGLERALQEAGLKMDGNDLSFNLGRQDGNEFSQEMRQGGTAGFGNGAGEAQAEGDVAAAQAAQVDTAAGLVNVQI
ncbi:MAG TPA: flagellar hook-length control protein FliK [Dongiaceae bacterium]|nr:flagellar hook-length control protein FliK [Dongiaceae bacterium]